MHCIYTYMYIAHTHIHTHIHTYTLTGLEAESAALEDLYDYVYSNFMEEIDAVDNGISPRDGEPRYVFMCGSSLLPFATRIHLTCTYTCTMYVPVPVLYIV